MRRLKAWTGLTLRQLERRAQALGESLPKSTLAAVLRQLRLPREELLRSFVKSCGCGQDDVDYWTDTRRAVAMTSISAPDR
ncbi:helix-turn-helix domain-containing protein [Nonomuraea sp. NPDC059007]|uniref:helix-turn-helix domain-containing protein n=1 Tax=Nonomuraea sp. NPDC059007 TaxID=3346692 RepID=UPI0036BF8AE8